MVNSKCKGSGAERELLHKFWGADWAAIRVAGSGSMKYPSCDLVVGKGGRLLLIECKSTSDRRQYISAEQIEGLTGLAEKMAAEPWVGVRFGRLGWLFLRPEHLRCAGKHFVAAAGEGVSFESLTKDL